MGRLYSNNFREEFDYLQLNQPKPSDAVIGNDHYLKYTRSLCASSDCFVWQQPLKFTVNDPKIQWNELMLNSLIFSDVLKDIKNSNCVVCPTDVDRCFCYDESQEKCADQLTCDPFKYGLTATNNKSDINLFTDFWEKTTEVYYYAQKDFVLSANLNYYGYGDSPLSVNYTENPLLLQNVGNDNLESTIALFVNKDDLYSEKELGFFLPNVFNSSKWDFAVNSESISSINNTIEHDGWHLEKTTKEFSERFDVSKLKNDFCGKGFMEECEFSPYRKTEKLINRRTGCLNDPLSSYDCYDYREDIFGNEYYLMKDYTKGFDGVDSRQRLYGGPIYVKCVNGKVYDIIDLFFGKLSIISGTAMDILLYSLSNYNSGYEGFIETIDVFYDTLIISCASDCVGIFQILMNYDTGEPYIIQDTSFFLPSESQVRIKPIANRWVFDPIEKNIYFVHQPYTSYRVNIYTYSLNDNKLIVDDNDFTNFIRAFSGSVSYNPTTRKLVFFAKGSVSSVSPSATQYITVIEYDRKGNSFVLSDSLLISDIGMNGYYDIIGSHLASDNTKTVIIEDHNLSPSKIYTIKL